MNTSVVTGFGRMNPISIGHVKMLRQIKAKADELGADAFYFLSHSYDGVDSGKFKPGKCKNPLSHRSKLVYCKDAAPFIDFSESAASNVYAVLHELYVIGYTTVYWFGGEDRVDEFERTKQYNGKLDPDDPNYFKFKKLQIVNAGARSENSSDPEEQASASLLRKLVANLDFKGFSKYSGTKEMTEECFDELAHEMNIELT